MKRNLKKAFTLVEMMIVVIIIGILMGALLPKLKGAQERARDTARKANLSTISTALQMYYNDNGKYPAGPCISDAAKALVPTYISDMPSDPQKGRIAFGTKVDGCGAGVYAYTSMFRKGGKDAGSLLLANVEAQGTVGNFVLPQNTTSLTSLIPIFSGSEATTNLADIDITSDDSISQLTESKLHLAAIATTANAAKSNDNVIIGDASYAEKLTCSSVNLAPSAASGTMCNRVNNQASGRAVSNNSMVFIVFN